MGKIWKVPSVGLVSLPKPAPKPYESKVFYTLFRKVAFGDKRFKRESSVAYASERVAFQVFRDLIGAEPLSLTIRPTSLPMNQANGGANRGR